MSIITAENHSIFIPEIWVSMALGMLFDRCVMPKLVSTDFKDEISKQGNTVNIPERGVLTANDKTQGSPVTLQAPAGSLHSLVLNEHKEVSFLVEDVAEAQSSVKNMMGYLSDAMNVISGALDTSLLELYSSCSQVQENEGDITEPEILAARKMLNREQVPFEDRYLVLGDSADEQMLQIERYTDASKVGRAGMITEGAIGRIHGFDVFTDPRVIVTLASPAKEHGLAFQRIAFTLATRPLPLPPQGTGAQGVYAEQNGVAMRLIYAYNASYLGVQCTTDILYGCIVLRDKAAVVVESGYAA